MMISESISRALSGASTLTLSDGFTQSVLECADEGVPLDVRTRQAKAKLRFLKLRTHMIPDTKIDSHRVLEAMLEHAPTERGKFYVACAIICCREVVSELVGLASDWLKFLLWPFKSAHKHGSPTVSLHSTPSLSDTQSSMSTVPKARDDDFTNNLMKRQDSLCAVIRPLTAKKKKNHVLIGTHIIRRSIAKGNGSPAGVHISLPTTWDILRHYADISDEMMEGLEKTIDSPSNGVLMDTGMHSRFDEFAWYFEPTSVPNEYNVQWIDESLDIFDIAGRHKVKFENCSEEHLELPNPKHLMIHATIAKVLHMSGVGEVLDLIMDRFNPGSSPVPFGKFGGEDLDIRLSLLSLAGTNVFHLPTSVRVH